MADAKYTNDCLQAINRYRAAHRVPPLTLNDAISAVSQRWAEKMARTGTFAHNPSASYRDSLLGENIAFKSSSDRRDYPAEEAVNAWYNEINQYDFAKHSGPGTGHFTQLVWKGSREIGIGRAQSRDGTSWYVVTNYYPPGNYVGKHAENVFPPRDGRVTSSESAKDVTPKTKLKPAESSGRVDVNASRLSFLPPTFNRQSPSAAAQRQVQTRTENGVTTTIVTETVTTSDGKVTTHTTETTKRDQTRAGRLGPFSLQGSRPTHVADPTSDQYSTSSSSSRAQVRIPISRMSPGPEVSRPVEVSDDEFVKVVVHQHNIYRRQHGSVGYLTLNPELCKMAQDWARQLAGMRTLQRSFSTYRGEPVGENMAFRYSSVREAYAGDDVVKQWYSDVSKYNFNQPEANISSAGRFTQIVWKASREIGVGRAFADDKKQVFVVCSYFPAGNVIGRFRENVLPADGVDRVPPVILQGRPKLGRLVLGPP